MNKIKISATYICLVLVPLLLSVSLVSLKCFNKLSFHFIWQQTRAETHTVKARCTHNFKKKGLVSITVIDISLHWTSIADIRVVIAKRKLQFQADKLICSTITIKEIVQKATRIHINRDKKIWYRSFIYLPTHHVAPRAIFGQSLSQNSVVHCACGIRPLQMAALVIVPWRLWYMANI